MFVSVRTNDLTSFMVRDIIDTEIMQTKSGDEMQKKGDFFFERIGNLKNGSKCVSSLNACEPHDMLSFQFIRLRNDMVATLILKKIMETTTISISIKIINLQQENRRRKNNSEDDDDDDDDITLSDRINMLKCETLNDSRRDDHRRPE